LTCIHGLDENNCPTCRVARSKIPLETLNKKDSDFEDIRPINPSLKLYRDQKDKFESNLFNKRKSINPNLIHNIPNPILINKIPNFDNKLYQERLNNLKLTKLDNFKIKKRVELDSPELKLKEDQ
jgi:hypothetical protein